MSIWEYANPRKFMSLSGAVLPWVTALAVAMVVGGLIWGFFFTPNDFRQGATVKIIYIHVPAAIMGSGTWFMMLAASLVWVIRRHHVSALAAKAAAPVGMVFTLIGLFTGAVWGQPMWGTWWEWDPRLTAFLILFLFYLGYMALWAAVENPDTAADLTAVLCLVGTVFAVISRYAILFWNQGLHQGASLSMDAEENVADVFAYPLWICIIGFGLLFICLVLLRTRTEIRARRLSALIAQERMA
ncbi:MULTISPECIES: heme ABC transporter permease [Roseobacteraceae]|jgi:heme exporter protein C|uniref:heme ABC transporter permease n=1 Tax=Roseobacteraceae TaxID=2854170 RepID=UPI0019386E50|nr:heme ABC transporter permease [Roseovarius sp. 10]MBE1290800.1 transcriptional regulator [Paracoccaceae bacterium]MBF9023319.1 transcriptional regulator [Rhodobacterales bacterium FZCC0069]MBF9026101.1 transcriptional regulator [Rhodobacterales bacterium HKCCD6035]MBF9026864.1 transcriptional regulator [Rhodobacterales bacterium FZCC0188]MBF9052670.1 transcriptional regulator [Rhodobacterales bacterium LSUCC1028]QPI85551.1 heme ABC transporter permease [Rhodobacterales bacterium HKCCA1288]